MTEKRFKLGYVCGDYGLIDNDEWIDLHSISENSEKNVKICINKLNELAEEKEQLKQLLREVEHELTSLTGLSCFDKCASQLGYVEVFDDDRIDLDYSDLLKKIEKVI